MDPGLGAPSIRLAQRFRDLHECRDLRRADTFAQADDSVLGADFDVIDLKRAQDSKSGTTLTPSPCSTAFQTPSRLPISNTGWILRLRRARARDAWSSLVRAAPRPCDDVSAFRGIFRNRWLWAAIALSLFLHAAVVYIPFLEAFSTTRLSTGDGLFCAAVARSVLWLRDSAKL